ncbi:MAG: PQQ-binding-like beta-propeller repeat protein [Verrucomicrobiota bacterium]
MDCRFQLSRPLQFWAQSVWLALATIWSLQAADQRQWGQAWSRNMVSDELGLADSFDPKTGRNIAWAARLGSEAHSTPVVAGGRVFIGTNNAEPRDRKHQGDRGVLMCFDEKDGHFLWQLVVPKREDDPFLDWPNSGISSPATIEGNRLYLVNNRGEVVCLDVDGLANGNDGPDLGEGTHMALRGEPPMQPGPTDADVLWLFDLTAGAGIWSHDAAHSSVLIRGPHLYLNTGTGVDNTHKRIRTPDAPSLVVLDKATGRYLARDNEHIAPRIFHSTWSAPSLGIVDGKERIFFCGGDGIVYAFEPLPFEASTNSTPLTLKKLWQFDPDPAAPKEAVHRYNSNRRESPSNVYGMPVFGQGRLFVAGGGDVFWGKNEAWLKCIDPGKATNAEIWSYPLEKHVLGTPAVQDGLVFIADCGRTLHCVDASNGQRLWTQEFEGEAWASPLVADGKVYLGTRGGQFLVMKADKHKTLLSSVILGSPISATATAANRTLFVTTMTHLYAVRRGADSHSRD